MKPLALSQSAMDSLGRAEPQTRTMGRPAVLVKVMSCSQARDTPLSSLLFLEADPPKIPKAMIGTMVMSGMKNVSARIIRTLRLGLAVTVFQREEMEFERLDPVSILWWTAISSESRKNSVEQLSQR